VRSKSVLLRRRIAKPPAIYLFFDCDKRFSSTSNLTSNLYQHSVALRREAEIHGEALLPASASCPSLPLLGKKGFKAVAKRRSDTTPKGDAA